ncbi:MULTISPECIES: hypothetical protein [unclassified Blastococcus]|uniref:hypothetical protein n=1 Tax=unclassified Blastococcus TaxID=2619396 RepID=UPI00210359CC|nr:MULTISPECIES: hypothetical protein [unclassified Blastococcus]
MTTVRPATHAAAARPRRTARPASRRRRPASAAARRRRGRRGPGGLLRWWPALVVAAALFAAVAWRTDLPVRIPTSGSCTLPGSSVTLSPEQVQNAATIAAVGRDRGLPERAVVIALATAMQESTMRNLDYGDRDSLGLFQQRPSQGWGTPEQVQDPVYAAGRFYDHLVEVPGWETRPLGEAAHAVQRSAFPELVPRWEPLATELASALARPDGGAGLCS